MVLEFISRIVFDRLAAVATLAFLGSWLVTGIESRVSATMFLLLAFFFVGSLAHDLTLYVRSQYRNFSEE